MASHIGGVNPRALQLLPPQKHPLLLPLHFHLHLLGLGVGVGERTTTTTTRSRLRLLRVRVSDADDSYLHMWKNAADKERKSIDFQNIALNNSPPPPPPIDHEDLEKKTVEFQKILQVSKEERDRIQRMQVIDRAAAAIAAARAILNENASTPETASDVFQDFNTEIDATATGLAAKQQGKLDSLCIPPPFFLRFIVRIFMIASDITTQKVCLLQLVIVSISKLILLTVVLLGIGKKMNEILMKRLHFEKEKNR